MVRIDTKVDSAGIYYNGAEVVRKGSAELVQGTQTVYVYGLSRSINYDTVRLFSAEGIRCSNQRFETLSYKEDDEGKESVLIEKQIDEINKKIEVKQMQLRLWETNGDFTNRVSQAADEIRDYIEKLPERLETLNSDIAGLEKQIEELQKKLNEAREKESFPTYVVDITASEAGTYPFELRYYESSANWRPVYEVYSDAKEALDVRMRATITQDTSEDWENASVTLYTGNPSSAGTLPVVDPIYLSFRQNVSTRSSGRMMAKNAMMGAGAVLDEAYEVEDMDAPMMMAMAAPVRMETEEAEVNNDDTVTEYVLPGRRDIKKGPDGTMADLSRYSVPAEYRIAAAACIDPHAYLIAQIKNADIPFTDSINAAIYLKDRYVGQVYIAPDLSKETIEITLGEEERVHVSRKETEHKQSTNLLKTQKTLDHVFDTTVTNLTSEEVEVELRDQIPVSNDKDITVEVKELSGAKKEDETGIVTKLIKVPANGTETFTIAYKVSWPKDKQITETKRNRYCPECGSPVTGRFCPVCGHVM